MREFKNKFLRAVRAMALFLTILGLPTAVAYAHGGGHHGGGHHGGGHKGWAHHGGGHHGAGRHHGGGQHHGGGGHHGGHHGGKHHAVGSGRHHAASGHHGGGRHAGRWIGAAGIISGFPTAAATAPGGNGASSRVRAVRDGTIRIRPWRVRRGERSLRRDPTSRNVWRRQLVLPGRRLRLGERAAGVGVHSSGRLGASPDAGRDQDGLLLRPRSADGSGLL